MSAEVAVIPSQQGWQADFSPSGAIRTRSERTGTRDLPLHPGAYVVSDGLSSYASWSQSSFPENTDGSCSAIAISVPAASPGVGTGVRIEFPFYGPYFGIRFRRDVNVVPFFDIDIDGVSYPVNARLGWLEQQGITSVLDGVCHYPIVDNLKSGEHSGAITVIGGAAINKLDIYGITVSNLAGTASIPGFGCQAGLQLALATGNTAWPNSNGIVSPKGISQVTYNSTYAAVVTSSTGATLGATSIPVVALPGALPAGATVVFPGPSGPVYCVLTAAAAAAATSITVVATTAAVVAGVFSSSVNAPVTASVLDVNGHPIATLIVQPGQPAIFPFSAPNTTSETYFSAASVASVINAHFVGRP